jgi:hypothetical protein
MRRPRARTWLVVAVAALAVTGTATAMALAAGPEPSDLPPISAQKLLASLATGPGKQVLVSGSVEVHLDLGLPQLPVGEYGPAANELSALLGDHQLRVWHSEDGIRVADLMPTAERDVYVSRSEAWAWDSDSFTAYHLGLPPGMDQGSPRPPGEMFGGPFAPGSGGAMGLADMADPMQLARWALDALDPTTEVTAAPGPTVAGRDVYVLTLTPRTDDTLVGRVELAVDGEHRLPLSVAVFTRSGGAAPISVAFSKVSFDPIDPAVYRFTPPEGATVKEVTDLLDGERDPTGGPTTAPEDASPPEVRRFGHDWATVIAVRMAKLPQTGDGAFDYREFLPLSAPLLSIRLEQRGDHVWLVYGAVPQAVLAEAGSSLR